MTATMKAVTAPQPGGIEALIFETLPRPQPGPHDLLVRVAAFGVNRADAMQRAGAYPPPPGVGPVLGLELAGEIVATGSSVEGFTVGERVFGLVMGGAYGEYALIDCRHALRTPPHWDDATAAAVIEVFCTAHETLFELGELGAGEWLLLHAAGSAVGTAAIQMAKWRGAHVVATAGAAFKREGARRLGADHVIDYRAGDFADAVAGVRPDGVDLVVDFVGASYFQRHLSLLRRRGRLVAVGLLGPGSAEIDINPILFKRLRILGFALRSQSTGEKAAVVARFASFWLPLLVSGAIRPVIHATLPFSQVREAHRMLEATENLGKIVVTVP